MKSNITLGVTLLRIALAFLLIVTGVWGITGGNTLFGGITAMFSGTARTLIITIISVSALVAGVLLLVEFFTGNITIVKIILVIFTILWIIQLILSIVGLLSSAFSTTNSILNFIYMLANNFLILAALIINLQM